MSRRLQIIRREIRIGDKHNPQGFYTSADNIVRVYGPAGKADSPDLDREVLLLIIANMISGTHIDPKGWTVNGVKSGEFRNVAHESIVLGSTPYKGRDEDKVSAETILLDAVEVIVSGKVLWRATTGGDALFSGSMHPDKKFMDLYPAELLGTAAKILL